jgi:hypothetical protein
MEHFGPVQQRRQAFFLAIVLTFNSKVSALALCSSRLHSGLAYWLARFSPHLQPKSKDLALALPNELDCHNKWMHDQLLPPHELDCLG